MKRGREILLGQPCDPAMFESFVGLDSFIGIPLQALQDKVDELVIGAFQNTRQRASARLAFLAFAVGHDLGVAIQVKEAFPPRTFLHDATAGNTTHLHDTRQLILFVFARK